MQKRLLAGIIIAITSLFWMIGCNGQPDQKEPGHVHESATPAHEGDKAGGHAGEKAGAHAGEPEGAHSGEGEIELSPDAIQMAEIKLAKASMGRIKGSLDLSGEIGFNEERLVHITPRFPGIVKEAVSRVGDFVHAGSVIATIESNESMTLYSLKAPMSGRVIEKHAAPGEHVSETESMYIIADLSSVWVNLAVYAKDAALVKTGQKASIITVGADATTEGTIQYVTPVMDPQTRRITARVVLPNTNNQWRPGTFVIAHVEAGESQEGLVVAKDAVQFLNNKPMVFVSDEPNRFKPVEVIPGESDAHFMRILGGLTPGMEYVNQGAFELKAKIVTSSLGGHAGHGH